MVKRALLSILLVVVVASVAGCGNSGPDEAPTQAGAPAEVSAARDAAVVFVREHFDDAPGDSLSWLEESLTPEGLVGGSEWQYTAGDWVVKVSYAVVAPEWTVYHVVVANESTGFEWEGRVDGSGRVPEAPENALLARDQALLYVSEQHGQTGLGAGLAWQEERLTPENIVGGETYQYSAGDWVVTVSYPVVLPENTIYEISVANQESGFQWAGEVDVQGTLTER
jgi:predicted small lipoprotein YifL